jgi:hypothetical protein
MGDARDGGDRRVSGVLSDHSRDLKSAWDDRMTGAAASHTFVGDYGAKFCNPSSRLVGATHEETHTFKRW